MDRDCFESETSQRRGVWLVEGCRAPRQMLAIKKPT